MTTCCEVWLRMLHRAWPFLFWRDRIDGPARSSWCDWTWWPTRWSRRPGSYWYSWTDWQNWKHRYELRTRWNTFTASHFKLSVYSVSVQHYIAYFLFSYFTLQHKALRQLMFSENWKKHLRLLELTNILVGLYDMLYLHVSVVTWLYQA